MDQPNQSPVSETPNSAASAAPSAPAAPTAALAQPPAPSVAAANNFIQATHATAKTKTGLVWSISSIVLFVAGFLIGFAALLGVGFGIYGFSQGRTAGHKPAMITGLIGAILNGIWYGLTFIIK